MGTKIQLKRGLSTQLPVLSDGEPGFCEDTGEIYVGTAGGNKKVTSLAEIQTLNNGFGNLSKVISVNALDKGLKVDGTTDDSTALINALAALNGTSPVYLLFPSGTCVLNYNGDISIPINVKLVSLGSTTLQLGGANTRLTWVSPGTSSNSYSSYWSQMNAGARNINFKGAGAANSRTVTSLIYISKIIGSTFDNCGFSNAQNLITIQNKDGLWTERTKFNDCYFGDSTNQIIFDGSIGQANPGSSDGSFAYTDFNNCTWSLGETTAQEMGIKLINGASLYGGNIHGIGWIRQASGGTVSQFINTSGNSALNYMNFNVKGETFGAACYFLNLTGGKFWFNEGAVTFPSPQILMTTDGTTDVHGNAVMVVGSALQNDAGTNLWQGDQIPSFIIDHLNIRHPVRKYTITMSRLGAANGGYIGALPSFNSKPYKIVKMEIGCKTAGSGNADSKWYFDFRKGFDDSNYATTGTLNFYLADGQKIGIIDTDYEMPDNTWYSWSPKVIVSSTATGKNAGTPPQDIYITVHCVLKH